LVAPNSVSSKKLPVAIVYSKLAKWGTFLILCLINLINYMDRVTLMAVLLAVQQEFDLGKAKAGLLSSAFMIGHGDLRRLF
jgi:hypothetical protein